MLFNLLQAAVDTTALTQAAEPAVQEKTMNLIDLATAGGWLMVVLLILSIPFSTSLAIGESYLWQSSVAVLILPS